MATSPPAWWRSTPRRVVSAGAKRRSVPVETLVRSGVGPGEIVVEVAFPLPADGTFRFAKAGRKALNSAAVVTVAAVVAVVDGKVDACRIGLGGVAPWPVRAPSVEKALIGKPLDRAAVEAAARLADADIAPVNDAYASAWYRAAGYTGAHLPRPSRRCGGTLERSDEGFSRFNYLERRRTRNPRGARHDASQALRENQGLTGTRRGCDQGTCGSCTVLVDGKAKLACLIPVETIAGSRVETVEKLAGAGLHPLQQAFVEGFATQCGFCTSGMIMAAEGLLAENPGPVARRGHPGHFGQCVPLHGL